MTTTHAVTQCTPFELIYARDARLPSDVMLRQYHEGGLKLSEREYLRGVLISVGENRMRVRQLTEKARDKSRVRHGKQHPFREYAVGEPVWLYKLWVPWRGPFIVSQRVSDTVYRLDMKSGISIDGTVSASRLQSFLDRANWPDSRPDDTQEEPTLHLPED